MKPLPIGMLVLTVAAALAPAASFAASLRDSLRALPYRIAYESYVDGNWEIFAMNADGSRRKVHGSLKVGATRMRWTCNKYPMMTKTRSS